MSVPRSKDVDWLLPNAPHSPRTRALSAEPPEDPIIRCRTHTPEADAAALFCTRSHPRVTEESSAGPGGVPCEGEQRLSPRCMDHCGWQKELSRSPELDRGYGGDLRLKSLFVASAVTK